jgi:arylsulfatase A-like enzyme
MSTGTQAALAPIETGPPLDVASAAARAEAPAPPRSPSRWSRFGNRVRTGIGYAVGAAFGMWLGDVLILTFTRGGATWTQWFTGIGAALFVAVTTALVLGTLLGPIAVPVAERLGEMVATSWRSLRDEGGSASRGLASIALTAGVLGAVWSLATYKLVGVILYDFARPDTMQVAMVLSHLAFTVTFVVAWSIAVRVSRHVVDWAAGVRGLGWVLGGTWRVVLTFGAPVLLAVGALAFVYRDELAATPWLRAVPVVLVVPALLLVRQLRRATPARQRVVRGVLALAGVVFVASSIAALRVHPESTTAQIIGFDRAMSGRLGYAAWVAALDFDRDGQINVLGGGDCAPFDRRRHTGATDIPGNHVDEDCDGADLSPLSLRPRSWFQSGVNGSLAPHPNVVLITIDALAAPRLRSLGGQLPLMPHLDALAADSKLFTSCFSQGPSTRLSFPSMFTSRWDSQLVFSYSARMPYSVGPKEKQLQDLMDDQGYSTVAVIPNTYFDKNRWPSVTRGFAHVDTSSLPHGKHNAQQVTDAALRELSEQSDRPLYMWVHYFDAHPPYGPISGVDYTTRDDEAFYRAELTHIDNELGRLISALEQRSDPTYIIVTSDHATVFHPNPESRHFHYGYDLYTATLHVPLIVHGPSIKPGRVDTLVSTMDVAPTILDMLHVSQAPQFNGWSLVPELLGGKGDPKRTLFHEFYLPEFVLRGKDPLSIVSVRDEHYNLILNRDRGTFELYDWHEDYYEQHELYEELSRSPEVAHLRSSLGAFLQQFATRPDSAVIAPAEKAPDKPEL